MFWALHPFKAWWTLCIPFSFRFSLTNQCEWMKNVYALQLPQPISIATHAPLVMRQVVAPL